MKPHATKQAERERRYRSQYGASSPIDTADLDDELVKAIEETVHDVCIYSTRPSHRAGDEDEKESREEKLYLDNRWIAAHKSLDKTMKLPRGWCVAQIVAGWMIGLSALALFIAFLALLASQGDTGWRTVLYPLLTLLAGTAGVVFVGKTEARRKKARTFVPDVLVRILPLVESKTALEAAYTASVAALLPHAPVWGQSATQTHLSDLRDLLHQGKEWAARRADVEQAVSRQSVGDTDKEAEQLVERLEQIHDDEARAVWTQSLAHLEGRRDRLQHLEPLCERLEAREMAIVHALREAQMTLADAHFTGVYRDVGSLTGPFVVAEGGNALRAPWTNPVSRIRCQTISVETALQEVAGSLRAPA